MCTHECDFMPAAQYRGVILQLTNTSTDTNNHIQYAEKYLVINSSLPDF